MITSTQLYSTKRQNKTIKQQKNIALTHQFSKRKVSKQTNEEQEAKLQQQVKSIPLKNDVRKRVATEIHIFLLS